MLIGRTKARLISEITIDANIAMATFKLTGLGAPADQDDSLRYGRAEITNAEIAAGAAIALSKLVDDYLLPVVMTTRGDLVYRAADFPVRIAAGAEGKVLTMGANDPGWVALAAALIVAEAQVFSGSAPTSWTDLDLSGTIGSQASLVLLKCTGAGVSDHTFAFRKDGDTDEFYFAADQAGGVATFYGLNNVQRAVLVATSPTGVIEWIAEAADTVTIDVIAVVK